MQLIKKHIPFELLDQEYPYLLSRIDTALRIHSDLSIEPLFRNHPTHADILLNTEYLLVLQSIIREGQSKPQILIPVPPVFFELIEHLILYAVAEKEGCSSRMHPKWAEIERESRSYYEGIEPNDSLNSHIQLYLQTRCQLEQERVMTSLRRRIERLRRSHAELLDWRGFKSNVEGKQTTLKEMQSNKVTMHS